MVSIYEQTNTDVRAFFSQGHKSSNKVFDIRHTTVQMARADNRSAEASISRQRRPKLTGDYLEQGRQIEKLGANDRAGNCWEMALLSGRYLHLRHMVPRDRIFMALVQNPGDHAFCLVPSGPLPKRLRPGATHRVSMYERITGYVASYGATSDMIVDPWLNTVCHGNVYLEEASKKLGKWSSEGKRIYWYDPEDGKSMWRVPDGNYQTQFEASMLELQPF